MLTQKEFVRKAYDRYKSQGLTPGDPNDGNWEQAHYPLPQPEGKRWIWLLREDHFVQGILQSEEVGRCCFWSGDCKPFLDAHWCDDWFDVVDLYEKWVLQLNRQNGLRTFKNRIGIFAPGVASKAGKKGGKNQPREDKSQAGKKGSKNTNGQKWISTVDGFISRSGNVAQHNKRIGADPNARIKVPEDLHPCLSKTNWIQNLMLMDAYLEFQHNG